MTGHSEIVAQKVTSHESQTQATTVTSCLVNVPGPVLGTPLPACDVQSGQNPVPEACSSHFRDVLQRYRATDAEPHGRQGIPPETATFKLGRKMMGGLADAVKKQMNRMAMLSPRDMNIIAPISS